MKKKPNLGFHFGERLRELRKQEGLTQVELGKLIGVSNRVIAYYEKETSHPPASLLPQLAQALNITIDTLLKTKTLSAGNKPIFDKKIWNKLKEFEKLSSKDQHFVLHYIDMALKQKK